MRAGTSGLMLTENRDGSVRIEVVDYGVEEFGGEDWESWFDLDKTNAELLFSALSEQYDGTHKEMLLAAFGETLDIPTFTRFCKERNIRYEHMTWYS